MTSAASSLTSVATTRTAAATKLRIGCNVTLRRGSRRGARRNWRRVAKIRGRRRRRRERAEVHRRGGFRTRLRVKERPRLEAEHLVQHVRREGAERGVVLLHRSVEVVPFDGNTVLRSF